MARSISRIIPFSQSVLVAIAQLKALPVVVDIRSKAAHLIDTVHPKRGFVRPQYGLVCIYQQDPFAQAADDMPEAIEIDGWLNVGHA